MRHSVTGFCVSLVLALSMLNAAFAHRAPSHQEEALRFYLLAGGDLQDICGGFGHAGPSGDACPLCPTGEGAALPPHAPGFARLTSGVAPAELSLAAALIPGASPRGPAHGARAPPFL